MSLKTHSREFVEWQIAEGSNALVPCGTTGESRDAEPPTSIAKSIATAVEAAKGRVPVIAGCGSNSTAAAIEMVRAAADVGADAALVVVPYYNKPSQAGPARAFHGDRRGLAAADHRLQRAVAHGRRHLGRDAGRGREASERSSAIKDATGNLARVTAQRLACGEDFIQLSRQ